MTSDTQTAREQYPVEWQKGYDEGDGDVGMTYDNDTESPRSRAYDLGRNAGRLEYLRDEINNRSISQGEIAELQGLAEYIEPDDVLLLEWAGVPEFGPEREAQAAAYKRHQAGVK